MTVTQLTRLTLMDLLNAANKHYDEKYLSVYFDVASGGRKAGSGDTLAEFIASELREGFDGKSSREQQVAAAVRMLERALAVRRYRRRWRSPSARPLSYRRSIATRKNQSNCTNGGCQLFGPFFSQNRVLTNSLRQATSPDLLRPTAAAIRFRMRTRL